jgi:probable HAF family extracellular repeat protein
MSNVILITILAVALAAIGNVLPVFATQQYQIIDLGTLPGGTSSQASKINQRGQIMGFGNIDTDGDGSIDGEHGFIWQDGELTDIGTLGGPNSATYDINERGQVVGDSGLESEFVTHAFIWKRGTMIDLGTLGTDPPLFFEFYSATAINDSGQVAGWASSFDFDFNSYNHVFFWEHGKMIEIDMLPGDFESFPVDINNRGQVVGFGRSEFEGPIHAFLWHDGRTIALGTLGGANSGPAAINERGQVVGSAGYPTEFGEEPHAFVWENGVMKDLGTLDGQTTSFGNGINDRGVIVGTAPDESGEYHGVLWIKRYPHWHDKD